MTMAYFPRIQQRPPLTQREFRGTDKRDALSIGDVYASDMKNLTSNQYPALTTRPGYSVLGAYGTKVLGLGVWKDTELHAVFNDGTWRKLTGSTWTTVASGLNTTETAYFTNFQGNYSGINLIMTNGVDAMKRYDGATVANVLNAPANAKYITTFQNRLWVSMNGDKEIRASSLDNAEEWSVFTDDSRSFGKDIESPIGETINGLFGELNKMTISFPNSARKLLGGVPSDFNDQNISQSVGVQNNKSAVVLDGMMYFLHKNGFYSYGGGIAPDKTFADMVQYYLDNATSAINESAAGTDGKNMYFSLPVSSSTAPDTVIEYDRMNRAWNVWKDLQPLHFAKMGNNLYIGDATGRVLRLGGSTDNGNPIAWHWVSKPYTAPSMAQVIRWIRAWVTLDLPAGSTFNVYVSKTVSGNDWELISTLAPSSNIQGQSIYIPTTKAQNAKFLRVKFEGTGPMTLYEFSREQDTLPLR